jgi:L-fuconolactonase
MRIDSHQHFWRLSRGDYGWLTPELGVIYRNFEPQDIEPLLKAAGVDATVVVQATDTVAETEFMLSLADKFPWIAGVVGWIDMESPDAIATLDRLAKHPKFKGIRPMIQGMADDAWITRADLDPIFDALVERDVAFDALVLPRQLKPLLARMKRNANLRCIIDHGAKPHLSSGEIAEWKDDMAQIAAQTSCFCKLSGLLTEAGNQPTLERIRPASDHLLTAFGQDRLMFGSDWPVLNLASDYAAWVRMTEELLSDLSSSDVEKVWGLNAQRAYRLAV